MKFVGLHAHTTFSIGDGIGYPADHFKFAIENGMDSLAITDHGNANSYGYMVQTLQSLKKKDIPFKPIFGIEAYIHPSLEEWRQLKDAKFKPETDLVIENEEESKNRKWYSNPLNRRHHLVLLAQNYQGITNLFKLICQSYRDGFYRYPRIDFSMMLKHNEGIIASTACLAGLPSWLILRDHEKGNTIVQETLDKELLPLMEIFGKDRIFLEVQFNKMPEQKIVNNALIDMSKRTGYKLVATADSHYARPEWWRERELYKMMAQQSKGWKNEKSLPESVADLKCELYPKNGEQMFQAYRDIYGDDCTPELDKIIKDSIELTYDIAHNNISSIEPDASMKLPSFAGKVFTPFDELKNLCIEGMRERGLEKNSEYISRLGVELKVIREKEFAPYFLTLHRAMSVLRKHMLVGPGRGSGAGSLVAYLLHITQLDPIKNGLLFERFLSIHRSGAPDIDTDIEDKNLCLEVLKEEFGATNVVPVSNFNTLQLKSLIKDISKFFDIPFNVVNNVTTVMEEEARQPILDSIGGDQKFYVFDFENAKKFSPSFNDFLNEYPEIGQYIEVLFRQIKSIGRHAGGVIITSDSESCMPAIRIRGVDQTPWTEGLTAQHLEDWGLIKFDFLGLATLRFIRRCIELILKKEGKDPNIENVYEFYNKHLHPDVMDPADQKVFDYVYHQGRFPGVFQFTETNAQNFCKRAKPESVENISAITSIYRPGPLKGNVDKLYTKARHGETEVVFEHPVLEEVLGDTYGFIVYQEQFMLLAHKLAGFDLAEADKLRKLLVKPVTSMAAEMKQKREEAGDRFIQGCVDSGLKRERAEKLWHEEILGFISYGFNKSHAMAYGYISYQCAWLLAYHEQEWIRAYLENDKDRDKAIADVSAIGYNVGKLDINRSSLDWEIDGKTLYPSLTTVKGVGDTAAEELCNIRKDVGGYFTDLEFFFYYDGFTAKTKKPKKFWRWSKFNKSAIDALIKCEAFDSLEDATSTFDNYKHMYQCLIPNYDRLKRGSFKWKEQAPEFICNDWTDLEKIDFQKELLGTYDKSLLFSDKVLEAFRELDIQPLPMLDESPKYIWFILKDYKRKKTAKGKPYINLKISDVDDKVKSLNFFGEETFELKRRAIYVGTLLMKGGWINAAYGTKIIKIS